MKSVFTCDPNKIRYAETRRGINATAPIELDGKPIATLYDVAEQIVAQVDFIGEGIRKVFLEEGRRIDYGKAYGVTTMSDDFVISEHARAIVSGSELP